MEYLDYFKFRRMVAKHHGNAYVKHFTYWHQLLTLMFGQLSGRESLRDLTTVLDAHKSKCYHLGLGASPASRNTLSVANPKRDYHILEEYTFFMMDETQRKCAADIFMPGGKAYAFDSTTIPLCLSRVPRGEIPNRKGGMKAHVLYDLETHVPSFYHITTASVHDSKAMSAITYESGSYYVFNRNELQCFCGAFQDQPPGIHFHDQSEAVLKFKCVRWMRRMPKKVLGDAEIEFAEEASLRKYPDKLRLLRFHDIEKKRDFAFLTNDYSLPSPKVADLHRN